MSEIYVRIMEESGIKISEFYFRKININILIGFYQLKFKVVKFLLY